MDQTHDVTVELLIWGRSNKIQAMLAPAEGRHSDCYQRQLSNRIKPKYLLALTRKSRKFFLEHFSGTGLDDVAAGSGRFCGDDVWLDSAVDMMNGISANAGSAGTISIGLAVYCWFCRPASDRDGLVAAVQFEELGRQRLEMAKPSRGVLF